MDIKEFWRRVEATRKQSGGDEERHASLLVAALVALGANAVIAFGTICKRHVALVTERADHESTHIGDDIKGEHRPAAFAYWLVGRGESEFFQRLAANDASDAERVYDAVGYEGTPLEYVVPTGYYECTGHDHPEWVGFSEYLAAGSGRAATARVSFHETNLDWGTPLHDLRERVPSVCDDLLDDARFLLHNIAELYYRLPEWKRQTKRYPAGESWEPDE